MMYRLRISLASLAALALILSGSVALQMRAAPGPSGQIVICSGRGPVTVLVDADGQPTGQVHICPDCTLHALSSVVPETLTLARAVAVSVVRAESQYIVLRTMARRAPQARGPPVV
ncbi:hypothetical protein OO012_01180 [Rhodobacteraceae bacterium KMM 6894]|nr:hypothetical protein [Rhodobacteraceae bacterium KMM 6894]